MIDDLGPRRYYVQVNDAGHIFSEPIRADQLVDYREAAIQYEKAVRRGAERITVIEWRYANVYQEVPDGKGGYIRTGPTYEGGYSTVVKWERYSNRVLQFDDGYEIGWIAHILYCAANVLPISYGTSDDDEDAAPREIEDEWDLRWLEDG